MDLADLEASVARLDALYRPVATGRVDPADLADPAALGARIEAELAALGVADSAETVLRAIVERYAAGPEAHRVAIRRLFDRYTSFRWAAHLPRRAETAAELRAHLIHLSARDQGADTRDELLALRAMCDDARKVGVDLAPILTEVAAMSSDEDRYGMGSTREILLRFAATPSA